MSINCRISTCNWSGSFDEIIPHCEDYHPHNIYGCITNCDFKLDDFRRETLLLIGRDGIYWFSLDSKTEVVDDEEVFKLGVFHIGHSEPMNFMIQLGSSAEGNTEYQGDFTSRPELVEKNNEVYDIEYPLSFLKLSRKIRLYVGEFDDSNDQYMPDGQDLGIEELLRMVTFPDTDEENCDLLEHGTCSKRFQK